MLFVAYQPRESQDKLGLPTFIHRTFTEEFNEKKSMQGICSHDWQLYSYKHDGTPVPKEMQLPSSLIMVCKGIKKFVPDFFSDTPAEWIVSNKFKSFLQKHELLQGYYEESTLTVLSDKGNTITDKAYFLLRFFKDDNALVNFEETPKVASPQKPLTKHTPPTLYYPELVFRVEIPAPRFLFLNDPSYWDAFFCDEVIKSAMEKERFLGFDFYTLEGFVQERLEREKRFAR